MNENQVRNEENVVPNIQPSPELQPINTNADLNNENSIKTNSNSPTNLDNFNINTVNIDANSKINAQVYVEEEKYKVSGTANEEDLKLDKQEKVEEVLDEHVIKRDVKIDDAKFTHNVMYIFAFVGTLIVFILLLPILIRIFG